MIKGVYTAYRNGGVTHGQFIRRWRYHGGLSMMQSGFWDPVSRYVQSDAIQGFPSLPGISSDVDGIGELWFADLEALAASSSAPELKSVILQDGAITMDHARMVQLATNYTVLREGSVAGVKAYILYRQPPGTDADVFFAGLEDEQADLEHMLFPGICHGRSIDMGSKFHGLLELDFNDEAQAARGLSVWMDRQTDVSFSPDPSSLLIVPTYPRTLYVAADS